MQLDEKSITKVITSEDIKAFQPSENLVANVLISMPSGINDTGNSISKVKTKESVAELMKRIAGIDIDRCDYLASIIRQLLQHVIDECV